MSAIALVDARSAELIKEQNIVNGVTGNFPSGSSTSVGTKGRVRSFSFNTTDDLNGHTLADDNVIPLLKLFPGETLLGFAAAWEAMGTGTTADIGLVAIDGSGVIDEAGTADTADYLLDGLDVAALGEKVFTQLWADPGVGPLKITKPVYVTVKFIDADGTTPAAADKDFNGYVLVGEAP